MKPLSRNCQFVVKQVPPRGMRSLPVTCHCEFPMPRAGMRPDKKLLRGHCERVHRGHVAAAGLQRSNLTLEVSKQGRLLARSNLALEMWRDCFVAETAPRNDYDRSCASRPCKMETSK